MLYIVEMPDNVMALSGISPDNPAWEANHIEIKDAYAGNKCTYSALRNMVTNILRDAGVQFTEE